MPSDRDTGDTYSYARQERQRHVDAVLNSPARHKVVVAGPGTGKSHLFKQILRGKKNALTLTFINALVADLALDLCGELAKTAIKEKMAGRVLTIASSLKRRTRPISRTETYAVFLSPSPEPNGRSS